MKLNSTKWTIRFVPAVLVITLFTITSAAAHQQNLHETITVGEEPSTSRNHVSQPFQNDLQLSETSDASHQHILKLEFEFDSIHKEASNVLSPNRSILISGSNAQNALPDDHSLSALHQGNDLFARSELHLLLLKERRLLKLAKNSTLKLNLGHLRAASAA